MKTIGIDTFLDFQFVSDPSFSPDRRKIAFVVKQADKKANAYPGNLYLYDLATGQAQPLTSGGDGASYTWTEQNTLLFPAKRDAKLKAVSYTHLDVYKRQTVCRTTPISSAPSPTSWTTCCNRASAPTALWDICRWRWPPRTNRPIRWRSPGPTAASRPSR